MQFTLDQFKSEVVSVVWEQCRCAVPAFQKLISFNFEDYGIAPTLLWDSEILIHEIIREGFDPLEEGIQRQGEFSRRYRCTDCQRTCTEFYSEYSINIYRSYVLFDDDCRAGNAEYLLGYRGFEEKDFDMITDFSRTDDLATYVANLTTNNS